MLSFVPTYPQPQVYYDKYNNPMQLKDSEVAVLSNVNQVVVENDISPLQKDKLNLVGYTLFLAHSSIPL